MSKPHPKKVFRFTIYKAVIFGLILLLLTAALTGYKTAIETTAIAKKTMDTLKQQCSSFNKLVDSDRTKGLFRLTDLLRDFSNHLADEPALADDTMLEQYVDSLRISGVTLLNGELKTEASGHTKRFSNPDWQKTDIGSRFADIITYPAKIFAERTEVNGEYYDVCAVARKDEPGIIIGYYKQPSGLISDTENDLESLLTGLNLEQNGHYAIIEDGNVRATSVQSMKDKQVSDDDVLQQLSHIEQNGKLHLIKASGKHYWGYRSSYEGYIICIYYPFAAVFSDSLSASALFAAVYFFFCVLFFALRNRTLYENQEKLKESNSRLTETVQMLRSLETIYFSLFYVDLSSNSYNTIYIAPWLEKAIPQSGVYTTLKNTFLTTMVVPAYREDIDRRMSGDFIRKTLCKENITDVRKSFYTDYQALRGGEIKWCRVSVTVVDFDDSGTPMHILALLQDVDREKTKEADYQAQILKEAHEAKVANLAKTEFLRRISHDIRTPINGIKGYIDMAESHTDDPEIQAHCHKNISAVLHTLLELVNSILDMSKLESDEVVLEETPFNLTELLDEINTLLEPQTASKNIEYEIMRKDSLPVSHLIGSPRYLSQILLNLASNAIKYGRAGGYLRLNTRLISNTEQEAVYEFTCEDNGIGMSEKFQKHLFEPFTQEAQNARTKYEGVGLGLSIVKKLVDALGGTITCHSEKDIGTTFRVQLTFRIDKDYKAPEKAAEKSNHTALEGKNVLLAEDNELNMEIAEFLLTDRGAKVTKAWNGEEAVNTFAASETGFFDIIFMDIMMPVKDGLTATREIRSLDREDAKTVPITAMSANAFTDDIRRSLDAGMNAHISKPIDEAKLTATAELLFNERSKAVLS